MNDDYSSTRQMQLRGLNPNLHPPLDEKLEDPSLERVLDTVRSVIKRPWRTPYGAVARLELSGGEFDLRGQYWLDVSRPIHESKYSLTCDVEFPWFSSHHVCLNPSLSIGHYMDAFSSFYRGDDWWHSQFAWQPPIPLLPARPNACLQRVALTGIDDPLIIRWPNPSTEQVITAVRSLPKYNPSLPPTLRLFIFDTLGLSDVELLTASRITTIDFRLDYFSIVLPGSNDPNTDAVHVASRHTALPYNASAVIRVLVSFLKRDNAWVPSVSWDPPFERVRTDSNGTSHIAADQGPSVGIVYLLRAGSWYKIGKSTDPANRYRQLSIQLPEKPELVHEIRTNDVHRLERHWHRLFSDRRANGEWFALTSEDVLEFIAHDRTDYRNR